MSRKLGKAKELKPCLEYAEKNGWKVGTSKNNHIRFEKPDRRMVCTSSSPSDPRSYQNALAKLKRADRLELSYA